MMRWGILWLACLLCGSSVECMERFGEQQNFEVWCFGARLTVMEFRGKNSHLAMAITWETTSIWWEIWSIAKPGQGRREGTSCFQNPSPRSPLLLIRGHESAGSYWLQNRPILSLPIYLLKSSWCPCYFTFHAFSRVGWVVEKKSVVEARRGNAPIPCMIKCYRLFDCNTTWLSAKQPFSYLIYWPLALWDPRDLRL